MTCVFVEAEKSISVVAVKNRIVHGASDLLPVLSKRLNIWYPAFCYFGSVNVQLFAFRNAS